MEGEFVTLLGISRGPDTTLTVFAMQTFGEMEL